MADYSKKLFDRYFNDPDFRRRNSGKQRFRFTRTQLIAAGAVLAIVLGLFWWYLISGLPSLERIENPKPELATKVYSIDGEVLDQFYIKNRSQVHLTELPKTAVNALLATEDKDLYDHWGVDLIRFGKAMVKNAFSLRLKEGASTITQQLSRNLYLGKNDRNVFDKAVRKIREFITSVQIERRFTKEEILEFYFNVVYFGRGSYGINSASQVFFGKPPSQLSLAQVATLIAMLKGPAYYDPIHHPDRAIGRRNLVLSQMTKYEYITEAEFEAAKQEDLGIKSEEEIQTPGIASHFVENIRRQMMQRAEKYGFDIYRDGLRVYTTLNARMQRYANQAVEEHLAQYQKNFDKLWNWNKHKDVLENVLELAVWTDPEYMDAQSNRAKDSISRALMADKAWTDSMTAIAKQIQVGFVAIDPRNGNILAMVGGSNFKRFKYGLNHVTQIKRQVGSAFKPFVYTVAIDNGYPPTYELLNQPVTLMMPDGQQWRPENYDRAFGDKMTLREGLKHSVNLIAVRAIMEIAPKRQVIEYAKRMGITSTLPPYESLALGSADISPLEMTSAFGVFANHGVLVEPISILRIEDKNGNVIEENAPSKREVLSDETAFIMTTMLQGVVDYGTGAKVRSYFHLPAAGKTGTTNDYADAWFVGYTPHIAAGVWVGFDNKTVRFTNSDGQGGRAAAPIWGRFMKRVYDDKTLSMPLEYFDRPSTVYRDSICAETKQLATPYCPTKIVDYFTEKTRPASCEKHAAANWMEIERETGTINY
ncbi:MAG: PBP1A family penicillin-binding protein [Ignavibacteriae bacterium]|nr:PBP1A family penicillin-binding protein [Ignavibacteriota bacterium]